MLRYMLGVHSTLDTKLRPKNEVFVIIFTFYYYCYYTFFQCTEAWNACQRKC